MEILSLIVAVVAAIVVWYFIKGVATLLGLFAVGFLVYYMHSNHPAWVDQVSIMVQNWVF